MLKIGITGGIGSGKSTIAKVFKSLGAPVYDADSRAKALMVEDEILRQQIIEHFGKQSYGTENSLNRVYLASVVFSDKEKTKLINSLVHPRVGLDFKNWIEGQNSPYIIKEAALMIESGSFKELDKLIVVKAPREIRISRVLKRDSHRTEESVKAIIEKQLRQSEMLKYADFVIDNSGTEPILKYILELHSNFSKGK